MALYTWQLHMKEWELNLDNNRYEICRRLKVSEDKLDEIINVLKEFEVIQDKED